MQVQQVQEQTVVVRKEPEYWRDPWSRALGTMFFIFGVIATIALLTGYKNIINLVIAGLAGLLSITFLGSFVLYNCGCICQDEKKKFRDDEAAAEMLETNVTLGV